MAAIAPAPKVVLTIGHSNRTLEDFLHLLKMNQVTVVADVRKMPASSSTRESSGRRMSPR